MSDASAEKREVVRRRQGSGSPVVLTRLGVAELVGFVGAHSTDRLLETHPDFPRPFFPFSNSPRWLRADVEEWIRKQSRAAQRVQRAPALQEVR